MQDGGLRKLAISECNIENKSTSSNILLRLFYSYCDNVVCSPNNENACDFKGNITAILEREITLLRLSGNE